MRKMSLIPVHCLVSIPCLLTACTAKVDTPTEDTQLGKANQAVNGGTVDSSEQYPYVVNWVSLRPGASGACSGVLVSSTYVLTSKHCFLTVNCATQSFANVNDDIQINFGYQSSAPTSSVLHTNSISGPVILRNTNPVDCTDGEEAVVHDMALIKLDQAVGFLDSTPIPVHPPPTTNHPVGHGLYCGQLVDNENATLVMVGFGPAAGVPAGARNYYGGSGWYTEPTSSCCAAANAFIWEVQRNPFYGTYTPGDSGGGLFTDAFPNDTGWGRALCGINSSTQEAFPSQDWYSQASPVDREDNADWIHSVIDRAPNPSGRPDGGFQGEPLPREDIFVRGNDGKIHYFTFDKFRGSVTPWRTVGAGNYGGIAITSEPSAVSWAPGRIDVFAINANNELVHAWSGDGSNWIWDPPWGRPPTPGEPTPTLYGVDVVSARPGRLDIFVTVSGGNSLSDRLYQRSWETWDLGWKFWGYGTRPFMEAPGAAAGYDSTNRLDVFAVVWNVGRDFTIEKSLTHFASPDGGVTIYQDDWGNGGFDLDFAKVDAATWGPGRLDIVAKAGNTVAHYFWPGGWNEWGSTEAPDSAPSIVSMGPGILSEFHRSGGYIKNIRWAAPPGVTNVRVVVDYIGGFDNTWSPVGGVDASSW